MHLFLLPRKMYYVHVKKKKSIHGLVKGRQVQKTFYDRAQALVKLATCIQTFPSMTSPLPDTYDGLSRSTYYSEQFHVSQIMHNDRQCALKNDA